MGTHDGVLGLDFDERLVEDGPQVALLGRRESREVVQQRRVEERELVVHLPQVGAQALGVADPELADEEEFVLAELVLQVLHKVVHEALGEVLHGVEAEALQLALADDPLAPRDDVLLDLRVRVVDVGEHEEVGVAGLLIDRLRPVLVVADEAEDGLFVVAGVVVGAAEVLPAVLLSAVLVAAAGEVEAEPGFDLVRVADVFGSVCEKKEKVWSV